jgi:hypothetical protein
MDYTIHEKDVLEYKKKRYARYLTSYALKTNQIVKPSHCELCMLNDKPITAHHIDYGKPLEITWLCTSCHGVVHKKNHKLNPKNNTQTFLPNMQDKFETITVTVTLPIENFLAIKKKSTQQGKPISTILKDLAIKLFPVESKQLEFKFMENHGNTQNERNKGVSSLENIIRLYPKPEKCKIQKLRSKGDYGMQGMDGRLFNVLQRSGKSA